MEERCVRNKKHSLQYKNLPFLIVLTILSQIHPMARMVDLK